MAFQELKPTSEEEWLQLRAQVLTATDMSVILGLNKWKSVAQLIESKKDIEPFENAYTWLGQALEPVVVLAVNKALDTKFKLFENGSRSFFVNHELKIGATPDAGDGEQLLECKSTKPQNFLRWNEWPPAYYLMQLYTQLICTDTQTGLLGIMSTDLSQKSEVLKLPLAIFRLTRTPELDIIVLSEAKRFWETSAKGKLYRVNRKQALHIEFLLRFNITKVEV